MKVLVVHPGDSFSTADVYTGLCAGLRASGCTVIEARLDIGLEVFSTATHLLTTYVTGVPAWASDAFALAAPRIIAQAVVTQPDAAIVVTGLKLHWSVPLGLRTLGIPTALLCTESPYSAVEQEIAPLYDHIFTHERIAVPLFGAHPSVHYVPHAFNPATHYPGPADPAQLVDLYFVGTAFPERRALLDGVNWKGITREVQGSLWQLPEHETMTPAQVIAGEVDPWQGIARNADAASWYRSARISLNHHRTTTEYGSGQHITAAQSLGPRAFEIAACGGFQLCDDSRPELAALFGKSVPTYRAGDSADLERQIRFYLRYPGARTALSMQQRQAVQGHTWHARAADILNVVANAAHRKQAA